MLEVHVEKLRNALKKDFDKLYVPEYTTTWESERLVKHIEIDIMSLDHTIRLIEKLLKLE